MSEAFDAIVRLARPDMDEALRASLDQFAALLRDQLVDSGLDADDPDVRAAFLLGIGVGQSVGTLPNYRDQNDFNLLYYSLILSLRGGY